VPVGSYSTFLTTASLAVGTWLINLGVRALLPGAERVDIQCVVGTATATLSGNTATGADGTTSGGGLDISMNLTCIATVTVAGTLVFQAQSNGGAVNIYNNAYLGSGNDTGYTAVKIA
jgi:hypothetical protein